MADVPTNNIYRQKKRILDNDTNAVSCGPLPPPNVLTKKQKLVEAAQAAAAKEIAEKPMTPAQAVKQKKLQEASDYYNLFKAFVEDGLNGPASDGDPMMYQYVWFLFKDVIGFFVGSDPQRWFVFRSRYDSVSNPNNRFTQAEITAQLQRRFAVYDKYNFIDCLIFRGNPQTNILNFLEAGQSGDHDLVLEEYATIEKFKASFKKIYAVFSNTDISIKADGILTILQNFIEGKDGSPNFAIDRPFSQLIDYFLTTTSSMRMKGLKIPCLLFFDEQRALINLNDKSSSGVPLLLFCIYLAYTANYVQYTNNALANTISARTIQYGFTNSGGRIINSIYDSPSDSYFTVLNNPVSNSVDARVCHPATSTIPWVLSALSVDSRTVTEGNLTYITTSVNRSKKQDVSSTAKKIKVIVDFAIVPSEFNQTFASFSIGVPRRINEVMNDAGWGKRKESFLVHPSSEGGPDTIGYQFITMFKRNALICFSLLVGYIQSDTNGTNTADMLKFLAINPNNPNSAGQFHELIVFFSNFQTTAEKLMMFNLFFLKYFKQISTQDKTEPSNPIAIAIAEPFGYLNSQ